MRNGGHHVSTARIKSTKDPTWFTFFSILAAAPVWHVDVLSVVDLTNEVILKELVRFHDGQRMVLSHRDGLLVQPRLQYPFFPLIIMIAIHFNIIS